MENNTFINILPTWIKQSYKIILLDIYSAGEAKIPNISSQSLGELILENHGKKAILIAKDSSVNLEDLLLFELNKVVKDGDIILMQGAGDVGKLTTKLVAKLKQIVYERY